jgi:hypothetical protein
MNPLNLIIRPSTVYQFAELLSRPYTQYDAFRKGIINENGQIVAKSGDLDGLEYIAMRVKNICQDLIPGMNKSYLSTLSGTLKLFNEEFQRMGIDRSDVNVIVETYLFDISNGNSSYLDYLLEEATHKMISEEMTAGVAGGIASPAHQYLQGGIAGIDRPMPFLGFVKRKGKGKKRKSRKIVEDMMGQPPNKDPYMTLQLDPLDYEELTRSNSPSGQLDTSQITNPELKKYFKRLGERSKVPVFVIGNQTQPPRMINFNRSKMS